MVVRCPKCETKLKADTERARQKGARFKCPKCATVFAIAAESLTKAATPVWDRPAAPARPTPSGEDSAQKQAPFPSRMDKAESGKTAGSHDKAGEEIEKARRLARTILSDISLYNANVVDDAVRNDTFFDILGDEIREGVKLYNSRIPAEVRKTGDYFKEAAQEFLAQKRKQLGL